MKKLTINVFIILVLSNPAHILANTIKLSSDPDNVGDSWIFEISDGNSLYCSNMRVTKSTINNVEAHALNCDFGPDIIANVQLILQKQWLPEAAEWIYFNGRLNIDTQQNTDPRVPHHITCRLDKAGLRTQLASTDIVYGEIGTNCFNFYLNEQNWKITHKRSFEQPRSEW